MTRLTLLLLWALAGCFQPTPESENRAYPAGITSPSVSRPEGPVSDGAHIIPAADEIKLDADLRDILDKTQTALIVVTVKSLGGQDVADYTRNLARQWKVGATKGGVVLLIAPNERQVRIETDNKVRLRLSDQQCAEIIQKVMLPHFRAEEYAGGIAAGVNAMQSHF